MRLTALSRIKTRNTFTMLTTLTTLALPLMAALATPAGATIDERQREAFRTALPHAEAGRWADVEPQLEALGDYPLLPDLRAAWLQSRMGRADDAEIRAFLERHPDLGFSNGLRRQWAGSLARRAAWPEYLGLYEAHYANAGNTVLDCHAFSARIALEQAQGLAPAVLERWLSPVSQPDACDPAFAWLETRGELTREHRRERMQLALDAGQFGLARWLAGPLGERALAEVDRWRRMHADPVARLGPAAGWSDTPRSRALLLYGLRRMASTDPETAAQRWPEFRDRFDFDATDRAAVDRRIVLFHAWRHLPDARALLAGLPESSDDATTRAWRVRVAIRAQDWPAVEAALARLPADEAGQPAWRYWQGRVLENTGRLRDARAVYAELAAERGYYSFMSADRLNTDYKWQHAGTEADETRIAALEERTDIVRARELFLTGQDGHGRIEWQRALARLSPADQAQAGILAQRWGWYSRAITAATVAGLRNDLDLRFPLPWRPLFEERSRRAGISSAWVYGIARSESLFMPDVRSVAGALGVMQLMPATGRQTAPRAGVDYRGLQTLLDPDANIALGTTYLAEMLARYSNHRVLATAAYNAGPGRVDRWLPEQPGLPADAWVESLPFNETRGYIQRVLASEAVFQWRLSGQTLRLADAMQPLPGRSD